MNESEDSKFTWNDLVKIKEISPEHPGEIAVVCGMWKIKNQMLADKYHSKIGQCMYTIEFENGSDTQISEEYLDKHGLTTKGNNKYTWGEAVLVKKNAPAIYRPGEFASICGIDKIITEKEAKELTSEIGEWIYLIEYEDGSSTEIPESYLENNEQS